MEVLQHTSPSAATESQVAVISSGNIARSGQRVPEFDGLRGLAALAVVVYHIWLPSCVPLASGVNLFFVLSGYLITSIILANHDATNFLSVFYVRRALRIWPIYYLALAAVILFNWITPVPESIDGLPYYLAYLQKLPCYWFGQETPFIVSFRHTWTLAIEEQYYLFWPLFLCLLGRRAALPMAVALMAVSVVARGMGFNMWILLTQCDGFAVGGIMAVLFADRDRLAANKSAFQAGAGAIGLASFAFIIVGASLLRSFGPSWLPWSASLKLLAINVFLCCLVALITCQSGRRWLGPLRQRQLVYLGQISYGMYLYHHIILITSRNVLESGGYPRLWWHDVLVFSATLAVSAASWRFIERPILGLKDRFDYGTKAPGTTIPRRPRPVAFPHFGSSAPAGGGTISTSR